MTMFCFQCEQTMNGKGCTISGVCGKKPDTANLQDELVSSIIQLANYSEKSDKITDLIIKGLFATVTNVNFDNDSLKKLINKVKENIYCDKAFDINNIWQAEDDIKSLKSLGFSSSLFFIYFL